MTKQTLNLNALKAETTKELNIALKDRKAYYKGYNSQFKRVSLRLTQEEFKHLDKLSKKAWLSPTEFIKECYLKHRTNEPIISQEIKEELKKLIFTIQWIANNINQIAKSNNLISSILNPKKAKDELVKINNLVKEFITKSHKPKDKNEAKEKDEWLLNHIQEKSRHLAN